jgi:hypothetical protein
VNFMPPLDAAKPRSRSLDSALSLIEHSSWSQSSWLRDIDLNRGKR